LRTALLALLAASCSDTITSAYFGRPPTTGANTEILAVHGPNTVDLFVIDLTRGDPAIERTYALPSDEGLRLEALLYRETAAQLGLDTGPLPHATEHEGGMALDVPMKSFAAQLGPDGLLEPWTETTAISTEVARARVKREEVGPQCPEFELVVKQLEIDHSIDFVVRTSTGALIGLGSDYRVYVDDQMNTNVLESPPMSRDVDSAVEVGPDEYVFASRDEAYYLVKWRGGQLEYETLANSRLDEDAERFAAGWRGDKIEIFQMSPRGGVQHYLDRWRPLAMIGDGSRDAGSRHGLTRLGDGEAMFAWPLDRPLHRWANDELTTIDTPSPDTFSTVEKIDGLGIVAGTSRGGLLVGEIGSWTHYPGESGLVVLRVAPFRNGVTFGGEIGTFGVFLPDVGICPMLVSHQVNGLVTMPNGVLLAVGHGLGRGGAQLSFFVPR